MNVYTSEVKESLTKLILSQNKINTNLEEVQTMFAKKFLLSIPYAQTHLSTLPNVTTHCDSLGSGLYTNVSSFAIDLYPADY